MGGKERSSWNSLTLALFYNLMAKLLHVLYLFLLLCLTPVWAYNVYELLSLADPRTNDTPALSSC